MFTSKEIEAIAREGVEFLVEPSRRAILVGCPYEGHLDNPDLALGDIDLDRTDNMVRRVEHLLGNRCRALRTANGCWIMEKVQ